MKHRSKSAVLPFLWNRTTIGVAGIVLMVLLWVNTSSAQSFNQSPQVPLFQTTLRGVGPGQIPVAAPDATPAPITGVKHYRIQISQYMDQILPYNASYKFNKTTLWGYQPMFPLGGGLQPQKHIGGIIVGKGKDPGDPTDKNEPIQITFYNTIRADKHIIPIDVTIPGANQAPNRTAIHLHGGLLPWISDGGPFDWFTPTGTHGLSFLNNAVLNPTAPASAAEYYYPLNQSARFMWYHDHAVGTTRLNAYAGAATGMLIRDKFEAGLVANNGLPPYIETSVLGGKTVQELPLVFQDKIFVGPATKITDPEWYTSLNLQPITQQDGSLWYAHVYDTTRWDRIASTFNLPNPSAIPEFFGDTMLVNGTVFPQAAVQARRYRFRMLNACNARFLNLQLYIDDGSLNGITLNANGVPTNTPLINAATGDSSWLQIGTEGGFLSSPKKVASNIPFQINDPDFLAGGASLNPALVAKSLLVAPAERPDVIIDFSSVPKNPDGTYKNIILYNDAASPFPVGDDRNDYFPGWNVGDGVDGVGNPVNGTTAAGFGPNTRVLMRFKVVAPTGTADAPLTISAANFAAHIDPTYPGAPWGTTDTTTLPYKVRKITLNEYHDEFGRLIQILGNEDPNNPNAIFGTPYDGTATYLDYPPTGTPATVGATEEHVNAGDTEIWEVYNATGDVHPMHFHLVNVQLLNREVFDPAIFPYVGTGTFIPPADNELGWKETVPMYPGTITRAIMKFDISQAKIFDKNMNPLNVTPSLPGQLPIVNGNPPVSPRTGGYEYVWHCHILEHEEHDMMHSLVVAPPVP